MSTTSGAVCVDQTHTPSAPFAASPTNARSGCEPTQHPDARAEQRLVVDEQHPDARVAASTTSSSRRRSCDGPEEEHALTTKTPSTGFGASASRR